MLVQTQILGSRPQTGTHISSRLETVIAAFFAALLGAMVIWGVGFSHIDVLHNAGHDTRHSTGFPCH
jgi:cobalt transporter subunit CbtB